MIGIGDHAELFPNLFPPLNAYDSDEANADSLFMPHASDVVADSHAESEPGPPLADSVHPDDGYRSSGESTSGPNAAELSLPTTPRNPFTQSDDGYGSGNDSSGNGVPDVSGTGLQNQRVRDNDVLGPSFSPLMAGMEEQAETLAEVDTYSNYYFNSQFVREMPEIDHIGDHGSLFRNMRDVRESLPSVDVSPKEVEEMNSLVESACKSGFCPLYPESSAELSSKELRELLEPLFQGTALSKELIYNLLLAYIPALFILDADPEVWATRLGEWEAQRNESDTHAQAEDEDEVSVALVTSSTVFLILTSKQKREALVIGAESVPVAYKAIAEKHGIPIKPYVSLFTWEGQRILTMLV
ncbi:hypothetical protein PMIN06_010283 [Paraphaeosphaeria minitans]